MYVQTRTCRAQNDVFLGHYLVGFMPHLLNVSVNSLRGAVNRQDQHTHVFVQGQLRRGRKCQPPFTNIRLLFLRYLCKQRHVQVVSYAQCERAMLT